VIAIVLAFIGACIAGVLVAAARRPGTYHVVRSIRIAAPRERVFVMIAEPDRWGTWLVPDAEARPARLEVTESNRLDRVTICAHFERPFVARNLNTFTLEPGDDATTVTWTWDASIPAYIVRLMSVVLGAERMFGGHFEAGLAKLKHAAEASGTSS
jgi:hypothetical protein